MTTIAECNLIAQSDHLRWLKRLILTLSEHVPGNNHVGQLLVGRLVFTPRKDETGRYYEFVGQGIDLGGRVRRGVTEGMVAPTGRDRTCIIQVRDFIAR